MSTRSERRDMFAAAALTGLLASGHFTDDDEEFPDHPWIKTHEGEHSIPATYLAFKLADEMIAYSEGQKPI